jgi:hypothetical protein
VTQTYPLKHRGDHVWVRGGEWAHDVSVGASTCDLSGSTRQRQVCTGWIERKGEEWGCGVARTKIEKLFFNPFLLGRCPSRYIKVGEGEAGRVLEFGRRLRCACVAWVGEGVAGGQAQSRKSRRGSNPGPERAEAGRRRRCTTARLVKRFAASREPVLASASASAAALAGSSRRGVPVTGEDERRRRRRWGSQGTVGARAGVREEARAGAQGDRQPSRRGDLRGAAGVRHGPRRGGQPPPLPRSHLVSLPFSLTVSCAGSAVTAGCLRA